jgi:plastocyanin
MAHQLQGRGDEVAALLTGGKRESSRRWRMKHPVAIVSTLGTILSFVPKLGAGADALPVAGTPKPVPAIAPVKGVIEGIVTFRGEIPKSSIADDGGTRRDMLRVDRASGGLQGVVVWLVMEGTPARERSLEVTRPSDPGTLTALVDQRDHEFVPRVLAVRSGQPVKFTNSDPANHNVRTSSFQPSNEFNVFTGVDGSYTHRFVADKERPVRLGCDIHPWMRGWIYVFDHPYFAVTDERGRFRIGSVPAGQYRLAVRQPDIKYAHERAIAVSNTQPAKVEIEIRADAIP